MGQHVSRTDFEWTYDEQPHKSRRLEILKKYPEIKQLFGHDTNFKWICMALVFIQIASLYFLQDKSWTVLITVGYLFGGVVNHALFLAIHDISHNTAFGHSRPLWNTYFGFFCNLPLGFPMFTTFKRYHIDHHRYLGVDVLDPDVPTPLEAKLFSTVFGKLVCVLLQPFFYLLRPMIVNPKQLVKLEVINLIIQIIFDAIIVYTFGWKMLFYLISGTFLVTSFHPVSGHLIGEHYMLKKGYETNSYYGPLNWITFNIGYHNEHHDFPSIPYSRLPMVKKIAPEYYDNLPQISSWSKVVYDFIMDPNLGPYSRIKRNNKEM